MKNRLLAMILAFAPSVCAPATTITTPIQMVADGVAYASARYAKAHNGAAPTDWSQLRPYVNMAVLDSQVGGSAEQQIALIDSTAFADPSHDVIVAVTTHSISEDRRAGLGRYTIWRRNGTYQATWQNEEAVKKQLESQGAALPKGGIYQQPDVQPESAVYDAAKPMEVRPSILPVARSQQPVDNVSPKETPSVLPSVGSKSDTALPTATPVPTVTLNPPGSIERGTPVWPWVIGFFALLVFVALALKRHM